MDCIPGRFAEESSRPDDCLEISDAMIVDGRGMAGGVRGVG